MRRFVSLLMLAVVSLAGAGEIVRGEMELAFGKVRQVDGSFRDVKGIKIPYVAELIEARTITPMEAYQRRFDFPVVSQGRIGYPAVSSFGRNGARGGSYGPEALQKCYQNDSGGLYGVLDPAEWSNPSSLDDITMLPIGVNKPWKHLTMGYGWDGSNTNRIIIRWRMWTTNIDRPEGQNDFTNEIGDFGGYYTAGQEGTWKVTFDVSIIGMASPVETVYWATQFRTDNPTGEGNFREDYQCVFSNASPPQVGSSLNQFWYDWDGGANGIYENTEIEMLSDGFSNLLYAVDIDSTSSQFFGYPNSITPTKGVVKAGDNLSLWYDYDDDSLRYGEPRATRLANPVAEIEVKSRLNSATISSLALQTSASCTREGAYYRVSMWRYGGGTPGWVELGGNIPLTIAFQPVQHIYAGTIPLTQFLNGSRDVRMRIRFFRPINAGPIGVPYEYYIDKVNWLYTSP